MCRYLNLFLEKYKHEYKPVRLKYETIAECALPSPSHQSPNTLFTRSAKITREFHALPALGFANKVTLNNTLGDGYSTRIQTYGVDKEKKRGREREK